MVDFSNIKAQDVQPETTRQYYFDTLVGEPSVILAPAHDSNPAFLDERLRLSTERAAKMADAPRGKPTRAATIGPDVIKTQMEEDRDYDRIILAAACIKSWGDNVPVDAKGKVVPFSADNCLAFLRALPNFVLDPFRNYAQNIYNFIDRPKADPAKGDALGESAPIS